MKTHLIYAVYLLFFFVTLSCINLDGVRVDELEESRVRKQSGSKVTVDTRFKVNNPSKHKLSLKKIEAEILRNGYQFADVVLSQKVKIPAKSYDYHTLSLEFTVIDVMAVITGTVDLTQLDDDFTASGFIKGGTGLFCKKIKFVNLPMSQVYEMLYGGNFQ